MTSSCCISSTLVIVDPAVLDYQHLIDGVNSQADVSVLDPNRDGIEQITEILANYSEIESLHLVSHGEPGALYLGGSQLEADSLERYRDQVQSWTKALLERANVLLYGCRVAAGDRGHQFVQRLSQLLERAIAASSTLTGSAALGGNWQLDMQIGAIHAPLAFDAATLVNYAHVLAPAVQNQLYGVSQLSGTLSEIRVIDIEAGTSTQAGTLAFSTFAAARDRTTGRVYYIESTGTTTSRVAYWNPTTNTNVTLGTTGVAVQFLKLAQAADGTLYGLGADTTALYRIDSTTGAATSLGPIAGFTPGSGDAAFDPNNPNILYATSTDGSFLLYRIDITTQTATLVGNTGLTPDGNSGSLAFGPDGRLYATASNAGAPALYTLDTSTGVATFVANTGNTYNDFATLPAPTSDSSIDVQATITDGRTSLNPGDSVTYTITVTNNSTTLDGPIDITSAIPTGITGTRWTGSITGGGSFPTTADQTGTGNSISTTVNLNAGASVTYTVTGTVSSNLANGTVLTATVTAEPDDGLVDPTPANNSDTDTTSVRVGGDDDNELPTVTDRQFNLRTGSTIRLTGLSGRDSDGTIDYYVINSVPSRRDGVLYLGDPNDGGTAITGRRRVSTSQIRQLYFQASSNFDGGSFTYLAQDDDGGRSSPGTVTLTPRSGSTDNDPPTVTDVEVTVGAGSTTRLRGLSGQDQDGTIDYYVITSIPPSSAGTLFLGNPNNGGTAITGRRRISTSQINQLYFRASTGFETGEVSFTYLAQDDDGDRSVAGTVTLEVGVNPDPVDECEPGEPINGNNRNNRLEGDQLQDGETTRVGKEDTIDGRGGNDVIDGLRCDDTLSGGAGNDVMSGDPGEDRLNGESGNDTLRGGTGEDTLDGGAGNDGLSGISSNDRIFGRQGQDRIYGGGGDDVVKGGSGDDVASGDAADDRLIGDGGNDTLRGGTGEDTLDGGTGNDGLSGISSNDRIFGREGRDRLYGGGGDDVVKGGSGDDLASGNVGADRLIGDSGNDTLRGGGGADVLDGRTDNDGISGLSDNDRIFGRQGQDRLFGGAGNDVIRAGAGRDRLYGSRNNDRLLGESGRDFLKGGSGADTLRGGRGRDTLYGNSQDDFLVGNTGDDTIVGGGGADTIIGGQGRDSYVYTLADQGVDTIQEFQVGKDKIDVRSILSGNNYSRANAFNRYIRLVEGSSDTVTVRIDANGNASGGFRNLARLTEVTGTVTANDFIV